MAADIHGSRGALESIPAAIREHDPDVFVACGDITHFGRPPSYAEDLLGRIPIRTFAVPGNCDPPALLDVLDGLGVNLHMSKAAVGGHTIVGLGGANPTPFGTPFEIGEGEIWEGLDPVMEPRAILASHPPPFGHLDLVPGAGHVGSRSVARIVEKYRPLAVLCGHIHEASGIEVGEVTMINPGPAKDGRLGLVDIDQRVVARIL
jgi:Icc-related predicted phosphoesterase